MKNTYIKDAHRFLAPYATIKTKGRLFDEKEDPERSVYQRDRDRIVHSAAFRRLEYKTQVFICHEGDHYRTRLTHTLEVAQLAGSVARELFLDEDLASSIALAHDLGHPPFGHAGERALQSAMEEFGGFDHNAQGIRILTKLESKYAQFDGLNLTWECLEGIAKHNGPIYEPISFAIQEYAKHQDLELHTHSGLEAQIATLCDDIAYNNHDVEDGIRADLFRIEDLYDVPFLGNVFHELKNIFPDLEKSRLMHEAKRRLINLMVRDLITQTKENITDNIKTVEDIRNLKKPIAAFSQTMLENKKSVKTFLKERMYGHYKVNRMTSKAERVVKELFDFFMIEPKCLPHEWEKKTKNENLPTIITDYISGMTDRFAFEEHRKIFDTSYKLIGD